MVEIEERSSVFFTRERERERERGRERDGRVIGEGER